MNNLAHFLRERVYQVVLSVVPQRFVGGKSKILPPSVVESQAHRIFGTPPGVGPADAIVGES